jgi:PST family polysaccharide transporter
MAASRGPGPSPTLRGPAEQLSLDRSLLSGIAWTGGMRWFAQLLSWVSTFIVARILTPADYGIVGMALVYVGLLELIGDFGVGLAIIQQRSLTREDVASLGGFAVALGFTFALISLGASFPVAAFFGEPDLRPVIAVYSATFVISAFRVVPQAVLQKDLRFRTVALIGVLQALTSIAVTLTLAILGFSYWALVFGQVTSLAVASATFVAVRPHALMWPKTFRRIRSSLSLGFHLVVARISWYLYSNADFAIVGRVLGKVALGAYTIGWQLSSIPVDRISAIFNQVTPAVYAAVQHMPEALKRYLLGITEGLALVTFPLSFGLAIVADDFILTTIGPRWEAAILPLRFLACYAGVRSLDVLLHTLLIATGRTKREMQLMILALSVLVPLFYVGTNWGTTGVALVWLIGLPFPIFIPAYLSVSRAIGLRLTEYARALWPALSGTIVMTIAVLAFRTALPGDAHTALRLAAQVALGALTYLGTMFVFHRQRVHAFRSLLREMRR